MSVDGKQRRGIDLPGRIRAKALSALERVRVARRDSYDGILGAAVVALALLAFLLSTVNFFYIQASRPDLPARSCHVDISAAASADMTPIIDSYLEANPGAKIKVTSGSGTADVYIDRRAKRGFDSSVVTGMPPLVVTAGDLEKTLRPAREYFFSYKRTGLLLKTRDREIAGLEKHARRYWDLAAELTLAAVGDIIPGRHVAESMEKRGVEYPFEKVAPLTSPADLTFGNLECPLTDRVEPPRDGTLFSAPSGTIRGLELLGLDLVTLANNHSTNMGKEPFLDTLDLLESNGIEYAGGGTDYESARKPAIVAAGGYRFAFLDYNSIEGSIDATANEPGVSWIDLEPWNRDDPAGFRMVQDEVRRARDVADFVIVAFHWGEEYAYEPNRSMVRLAHLACDAGADMVVGQHPHTIQPIEYYRGKLIAYSLGNFIFDQRFNEQVRQGFVMRTRLKKLCPVSIELLPCRISGTCQTVPQSGSAGRKLAEKLFTISGWDPGRARDPGAAGARPRGNHVPP